MCEWIVKAMAASRRQDIHLTELVHERLELKAGNAKAMDQDNSWACGSSGAVMNARAESPLPELAPVVHHALQALFHQGVHHGWASCCR